MMLDACLDDLLIRGLDDWIQAAEVASVARTIGGAESGEMVRALSLQLIRTLLESRLIEVGMVDEHEGFVPWRIPAGVALERIESEWSARPTGPGLGEVCWLNLTEQGQARAQALWSKKGGQRC